jgi:hypothetical protein
MKPPLMPRSFHAKRSMLLRFLQQRVWSIPRCYRDCYPIGAEGVDQAALRARTRGLSQLASSSRKRAFKGSRKIASSTSIARYALNVNAVQ